MRVDFQINREEEFICLKSDLANKRMNTVISV